MTYSANLRKLCHRINPFILARYLSATGWNELPVKKSHIKIFQNQKDGEMYQVIIPTERDFIDYEDVLYSSVCKIADLEEKSVEQTVLNLVNPNSDILKIRLERDNMEPGQVFMDDAVHLFENAKKLLSAAAMDVINPSRYHIGRPDESVTAFLNNCRFGQTEVGSYIVSVVCPFVDASENQEYQQLSLFSNEKKLANSLTRKVTNQIIESSIRIKESIDSGTDDNLIKCHDDDSRGIISANFLDAIAGFGIDQEASKVDLFVEWSPIIKNQKYQNKGVSFSHDYFEPIRSVSHQLHGTVEDRRPIIGRVRALSSIPDVEKRTVGTAKVVYLDDLDHKKTISVILQKPDYEKAIHAHEFGSMVRVVGTPVKNRKNVIQCENFSVLDE